MVSNNYEILNTTRCVFCAENNFYTYKLLFDNCDIEYFIIHKTPNFIVISDIAPLVEGHLLIISLTHHPCFGNLLNEHYEEFQDVKRFITKLLTKVYTKPIFFEHGPVMTKRAGCCIDHAHIHCLPVNTDLLSTISKNELTKTRISSIIELCDYNKRNIAYLFYETKLNVLYTYPLTNELDILPSQYFRMVVAANLKLARWDWREMITNEKYVADNKSTVIRTIEKLKKVNL